MKQLRPTRAMLHCWFCGGRVVPVGAGRKVLAYRCEAEEVRWEASENLAIYARDPRPPKIRHDPSTGRFVKRKDRKVPA